MVEVIKEFVSGTFTFQQILMVIGITYFLKFLDWLIRASWLKYQKSKKPNSHDLKLWDNIKDIQGSANFWRERYIAGGSFPYQKLVELDTFVDLFRYNKPDMQFLNKKLEKLKAALVKKADLFRRALAENTEQPVRDDNRLVFSHNCPGDSFDKETTERAKKIDSVADDFVKAFDEIHDTIIKIHLNKKL